jgi:hypothetical protein
MSAYSYALPVQTHGAIRRAARNLWTAFVRAFDKSGQPFVDGPMPPTSM